MIGYIILGTTLGLPLVLGILFRVNTSFLFLGLLGGELLMRYFGDDATLVLSTFVNNKQVEAYAELAVLILPVFLTAFFLKHTLSKGKLFLHFIPFLITGIVFAAFALPVLPAAAQAEVRSLEIGNQFLSSIDFIVGIMVFLQLVALWIGNRAKPDKKHK